MPRHNDFTYLTYHRLLDAGITAEYDFLTVEQYLTRRNEAADSTDERGDAPLPQEIQSDGGAEAATDPPRSVDTEPSGDRAPDGLPERFVIMRHDVDRKPRNALAMARIEAELGIQSTYYVRTIEKTFEPDLIRRIEALGHEIGYHYEDVDRADGNPREAIASFETELDRLRELVDVRTVCMHGNPLSPHDNRDLWDHTDVSNFDLLGEAYLATDFTDVTYFTDTGRTWRDGDLKIKDHTMGEGEKDHQVDTTFELAGLLLANRVDRACILSHPNRWAGSYPELLAERTKDTAVNVVKRGLNLVS